MILKEICFIVLSIEYFINVIIGFVLFMYLVIKGMVFMFMGFWFDFFFLVYWFVLIRFSFVIICDVFDFVRKYLWVFIFNWDYVIVYV